MHRTLLIIAFTLLALIGGTGAWGLVIPVAHTAANQITVPAPPESVYTVIRDIKTLPSWWHQVTAVEPVPSTDGWERWKETTGGMQMTMRVQFEEPGIQLVTAIDTAGHPPFGGTWTYSLKLAPGGGTTVTIVEAGTVTNPFFRVMLRLSGPYATLDSYLTALGAQFRTAATPVHVVPESEPRRSPR